MVFLKVGGNTGIWSKDREREEEVIEVDLKYIKMCCCEFEGIRI